MPLTDSLQDPTTWPDFTKKSVSFVPLYPSLRPRMIRNGPRARKPSLAQQAARAIGRFCHVQWLHLDTSAKNTWINQATIEHISPVAVLLGYNVGRWYADNGPSWEYPATETSTQITPINATATAIPLGVSLYAEPDTTTWLWGFSVHRSTSASFTAGPTNCIMIGHTPDATAFRWVDTPLPRLTHYYKLKAFTFDGVLGAASAEVSATPL